MPHRRCAVCVHIVCRSLAIGRKCCSCRSRHSSIARIKAGWYAGRSSKGARILCAVIAILTVCVSVSEITFDKNDN